MKTGTKVLLFAAVGVGGVLVWKLASTGEPLFRMLPDEEAPVPTDPWTTPILFDSGSLVVSRRYNTVLSNAARHLLQNPADIIEIMGHTDSTGDEDRNYEIGYDRAESVGAFVENAGVPVQQIDIASAGPADPVASNATNLGRAQNRRVTLRLLRGARS